MYYRVLEISSRFIIIGMALSWSFSLLWSLENIILKTEQQGKRYKALSSLLRSDIFVWALCYQVLFMFGKI